LDEKLNVEISVMELDSLYQPVQDRESEVARDPWIVNNSAKIWTRDMEKERKWRLKNKADRE
jgi:hypothetical protein